MSTSWDLVRPQFWYPMLSLEQSMMELEQMSDVMMRPRFLFDKRREMLVAPKHADENSDVGSDDDDFFVDLPVEARKYKSTTLQLSPGNESSISINKENNTMNSRSSMEGDDEGSDNVALSEKKTADPKTASNTVKTKIRGKCQDKHKKQLHNRSYKVTPATERNTDGKGCNFSSYSFSSSSSRKLHLNSNGGAEWRRRRVVSPSSVACQTN